MRGERSVLQVGDLAFEVVPLEEARFDERGAIQVVLDLNAEGAFVVLDVGETSEEGVSSFNTPARHAAWRQDSANQELFVGTYLVPVETLFSKGRNPNEHRAQVAQRLRKLYRVTLGGQSAEG